MLVEKKVHKRIRMFPTIEDWAVRILAEAQKPMNYIEITKKIMENRPIGGGTPKKTVYATLLRSERIKPIGNGFFIID